MDMSYVESVSVEVCTMMTWLGYGEETRRWRVRKYRENDRLRNARRNDVTGIITGSKAEGLTGYFESDMDLLFAMNNVLCVEAGINLQSIPDKIDVFRMDTCLHPGYCRLFQERQAHRRYDVITNALCDSGYGDVLLSSSLFLDEFSVHPLIYPSMVHHGLVVHYERAGPSIPKSVDGVLIIDRVAALPCHCPSILQRWVARPRHWPPPFIVQKVVSLGAYLTPVGFKGSEYKHIEWRICFNTGEAELVNNLNDTQAKVYVILKMILKDIMKPINKEITSYVLKNIILWQAENNLQTEFHARSLLHWLHDGLRELRTAIAKKQLSYYMIPERNLMAACGLEDALQHKWVADLTDMLEEGPRVILRLEKIRKAIISYPEPMLWFNKNKMELEMLYIERMNRVAQCIDENGKMDVSDFILNAIMTHKEEIWIEMMQRMHQEGSAVKNVSNNFIRVLL